MTPELQEKRDNGKEDGIDQGHVRVINNLYSVSSSSCGVSEDVLKLSGV